MMRRYLMSRVDETTGHIETYGTLGKPARESDVRGHVTACGQLCLGMTSVEAQRLAEAMPLDGTIWAVEQFRFTAQQVES